MATATKRDFEVDALMIARAIGCVEWGADAASSHEAAGTDAHDSLSRKLAIDYLTDYYPWLSRTEADAVLDEHGYVR